MHENQLAKIIVDCAFKVHTTLGPGLLENVYQAALSHELRNRGLTIAIERGIPAEYDEVKLDVGFRADFEQILSLRIRSSSSVSLSKPWPRFMEKYC